MILAIVADSTFRWLFLARHITRYNDVVKGISWPAVLSFLAFIMTVTRWSDSCLRFQPSLWLFGSSLLIPQLYRAAGLRHWSFSSMPVLKLYLCPIKSFPFSPSGKTIFIQLVCNYRKASARQSCAFLPLHSPAPPVYLSSDSYHFVI